MKLDLIPDVKTVRIGDSELRPSKRYRFQNDRWQIADAAAKPPIRPYEAGRAANLYQGEPLLIVYGTGGDHTSQLRAAAQKLAAYGGPTHTAMRLRFPVVADTALTAEQQAGCNLILIGKPDENSVTKTLWTRLPAAIEENALVVADRTPFRLQNQVLGLLHPNPNHPDRLLYILAPFCDKAEFGRFSNTPHLFLAGSDGFDRVSQPDLVVQDLQHRVARHMQFGEDWKWLNLPEADTPIPRRFDERANLAIECLHLMLSKSHADFGCGGDRPTEACGVPISTTC